MYGTSSPRPALSDYAIVSQVVWKSAAGSGGGKVCYENIAYFEKGIFAFNMFLKALMVNFF